MSEGIDSHGFALKNQDLQLEGREEGGCSEE